MYDFRDPGSVGVAAVLLNICVLGGCVLAVGYALLAVNRAGDPRTDRRRLKRSERRIR